MNDLRKKLSLIGIVLSLVGPGLLVTESVQAQTTRTNPAKPTSPPPSRPSQAVPVRRVPLRDATFLFNQGISKFVAEDYLGALSDYNQAIKLNAKFTEAYIARGEVRRLTGDIQGAIEDQTRAIQLAPEAIDAYVNRCAARYEIKDYQGSVADCTEALKLDAADADAYYNRGLARRRLARTEEALSDFQKAAELYQQQLDQTDTAPLLPSPANPNPALSLPAGGEPDPAAMPLPPAQQTEPAIAPVPASGSPSFKPPNRGAPRLRTGGGATRGFVKPRGRGIPGRRESAGTR